MKTINSIRQLQAEKKRIKKHQQELEIKLQHNWDDLKGSLTPSGFAAATFNAAINNKREKDPDGNTILRNIFNIGATVLANKLADKTGEKIRHIFHKKHPSQ